MRSEIAMLKTSLSIVLLFFVHHSTARYDLTRTLTYQGAVTELIWQNPHVIIVMDSRGEEVAFEIPGPTNLARYHNWTQDTVKVGDKITVKAHPARNGQLPMHLVTVTLPGGREISPAMPDNQ